MIRFIVNSDEKRQIAAHILGALPDWFGMPEYTKNYIDESACMPFWACFSGDAAVDFITLKETSPHTSEIYVMGVLPEFHRHGFGRKLWDHFKEYAVSHGYEYVQVKTVRKGCYDEYDRTNAFYESIGFRELECLPLWDEWNPCQIYIQHIG